MTKAMLDELAAFADEHHGIAGFHLGNIRHIHHKLIHTHSAQNGGSLATDQHIEFIAQAAAVAIGIAHGNRSNTGGASGGIGAAVTDFSSGRQRFQERYAAVPGKSRANRQQRRSHLIAGIAAI